MVLISIDLIGASLILLLWCSCSAKAASPDFAQRLGGAKLPPEAAVAERTEHLLAAHEELRHRKLVLKNTFQGMAEAVLAIDPRGEVLLSNPAAEKMLRYKPVMNVQGLRSLSNAFHADGATPMPPEEMPSTRALRGEQFDEQEIVARHLGGGNNQLHLVVSVRPIRDKSGATGRRAGLSRHHRLPRYGTAGCARRRSWRRSAS